MPPWPLFLYRWLTIVSAPLSGMLLEQRARRGKEDPKRLTERFGRASHARPPGFLVWLHGASVGESLLLLDLVRRLSEQTDWHFLVTTGTTTSAELMTRELPEGAVHQYVPIDRPACIRRFFDHWRPDAAVFVESELWPNLLMEMRKRGMPAALANARMNAASLEGWSKRRTSAQYLLSAFKWIGAADQRTQAGLSAILGRDVQQPGNLKLQTAPLSSNAVERDALRNALAGRPVWLAASTHAGEDGILLDAHRIILRDNPDALLILAPRHPERGDDLAAEISASGWHFARRSNGGIPESDDQVWLADTLGEMSLWYALADQAFIAGSLIDGIGGHNPVEATRLGCAVITGPYTASFDDVYTAYAEENALIVAADAEAIARALGSDPTRRHSNAEHALERLTSGAMEETLRALLTLVPGTSA
ncbi:3-deoxy-D-manno-octulosonic acid transferase [Hyphobacterium sp.]|jgi:3-deoxy-D-manno-octulosonic-acid transferase|uniref:3-deoxy-D-manno-octulosonic acid transferase n=1 Tax=Hyphobacterium sp. TaxID=2004662 RepID=UPI003BA97883